MPQPGQKSRMALGCTALFLAPFYVTGVFVFGFGITRLLAGAYEEGAFLTLFGLVFGGVGFGILAMAIVGHKREKGADARREQHPDEPWLWRAAWQAGRIESSTRTTMITAWVFALLWNLISAVPAVMVVEEFMSSQDKAALLVLIFPLVGMFLMVWAVRAGLRHRKYGVTQFEMAHVPGVIGRGIGGLVRTSVVVEPEGGFQVSLTCVNRRVTGTGKNRSTSESVRWQEHAQVQSYQQDPEGEGTIVPVAFRLPRDVPASDDTDPRDGIVWRLRLTADVPGIDFDSTFEVPVFRTAESEEPVPETAVDEPVTPFTQPADSPIRVTQRGQSDLEIYFPAARHVAAAVTTTVFFLVWSAVLFAIFAFGAGIVFEVVFGFFELLLLYAVLTMWFGILHIQLHQGRLDVRSGWLFRSRTKQYRADEVQDVTLKIGMQHGNTPFYDIVLNFIDGSHKNLGGSVRNKREAEWLIGLIKSVGDIESANR